MEKYYDFMDSALRAGYPYVMIAEAALEGKVDAVVFSSYKDIIDAYKDAARQIAKIEDVYDAAGEVVFRATIYKTEEYYDLYTIHNFVCLLSRYTSGRMWVTRSDLSQTIVREGRR